jgi:fermentation-respiration switch protein FrsA (DUF1100 family)
VRALVILLAGLILVYVAFGVMLYLLQGSMVFLANLPGRTLDATPGNIDLSYEDVQIDTADGERLHGWYVPAANARGALLFFHGNAGNISHRLESIQIFNRLGLDVLIVDYRGYGRSSGKPSERGTYLDARAAWNFLVRQKRLAPAKIVVFGRSLGGAVGAKLAAGLAAGQQPADSRDDEIIPIAMGRAIFDAVTQPKAFIELRGDHNAGFWISRERYAAGLAAFLEEHLPQRPPGSLK